MSIKSSLGVVIGLILNLFTNSFNMFGEMNAGKLGPSLMFSIPKYKRVNKIHTAFCSYHDKTNDNGSSLTEQLKAFASSLATFIAE